MHSRQPFPPSFLFGAATSAFQIEGAWKEDGKGESIWDRFCHSTRKVSCGHNGDLACDHYHRYKEDVELMRVLGLSAYRFSVSWPRVLPEGIGRLNSKGLDFYDRLVDELRKAGIVPFATLFHWDLPQSLQKNAGGFQNRECIRYFADYACKVTQRLGDRVKYWGTINEPWVYAVPGVLSGTHAPGGMNPWAAFQTLHNLLLAHGTAVEAIKSYNSTLQVGPIVNLMPIYPMTPSAVNVRAADICDQFYNRIKLDPLLRGRYPDGLLQRLRLFRPRITPDDMDRIRTPSDFVAVNHYTCSRAYHRWYIPFFHAWMTGAGIADREFVRNGVQHTSMGWEVCPVGIYEVLMRLKNDYGNPKTYITENGAAFEDRIEDNAVHDVKRIDYLQQYVQMVGRALADGVNLGGYFAWSLLDNFEWSAGYTRRFGLVHVDFGTQRRTIKDSGRWYSKFIRQCCESG